MLALTIDAVGVEGKWLLVGECVGQLSWAVRYLSQSRRNMQQ